MEECRSTTETIQRPVESRYIPREFVEAAPVEDGPDTLMIWFDNTLHKTVEKEVEASRQFLPPKETIAPPVLESLDHLHNFQAKTISQVLIRYADNIHQLAMLNDPHRVKREKEAREKIPKLYKNKRPLTKERLHDQQIPLVQLINAFQLQPEKEIVDDLFEQANSFSSEAIFEVN